MSPLGPPFWSGIPSPGTVTSVSISMGSGTWIRTLRFASVSTHKSPPQRAVARGTGTSASRSLPERVNTGWGFSFTRNTRSCGNPPVLRFPGPPLPLKVMRVPSFQPGLHSMVSTSGCPPSCGLTFSRLEQPPYNSSRLNGRSLSIASGFRLHEGNALGESQASAMSTSTKPGKPPPAFMPPTGKPPPMGTPPPGEKLKVAPLAPLDPKGEPPDRSPPPNSCSKIFCAVSLSTVEKPLAPGPGAQLPGADPAPGGTPAARPSLPYWS
mmetsp:Transcript_16981/g.47417  ORF Transcript_16981/g.47417 Transcript_16981/m.47417 type:complete len:267 (-) Transcript_16981:288-1088(-)